MTPADSLEKLIEAGYDINNKLFCPSDFEYKSMKDLFETIFMKANTTTETGRRLEDLVLYLFKLCPVFNPGRILTSTSQIDCFVRNKLAGLNANLFTNIGSHFIIECKNENKIPSSEYMKKLHSDLSISDMKFGIIFSKCRKPRTFIKLSNKYFLKEKIVIISFDKEDMIMLVENQCNLLETIERKICEVKLDATSDLIESGIYSS